MLTVEHAPAVQQGFGIYLKGLGCGGIRDGMAAASRKAPPGVHVRHASRKEMNR